MQTETLAETIKQAMDDWDNATDEQRADALAKSAALARNTELEAENERAWGERDHYMKKLQERNTQLQQAEAVASSSDTLLGEATRWARDARELAERADATIERLKCCGNCFHSSSAICCEPQLLETDGDNYVETNGGRNACHFTPPRWVERSET